jgi:DNA-binding transcriptional LysR family regulator
MDLQLIGGLVASGLGLTALPRSTFTHLGQAGLAARSLNDPVMQRRIGILSLAGRSMSTAVERFCSYVEQNALSHVVGN